jgi:hypothetical protein
MATTSTTDSELSNDQSVNTPTLSINDLKLLGPQPNFTAAADSIQAFRTQVILGGRSNAQGFARLDAAMEDFAKEIDSPRIEIRANYHSSSRFITNTLARHSQTPLSAFNNVTTNQPIPGFPATVDDIDDLSLADLGAILQALGLSAVGGRGVHVRRLRAELDSSTFRDKTAWGLSGYFS